MVNGTSSRHILTLIALLGLLLRLGLPGSLGLDHFDEGIYAFAGEWPFARGGLASIDPMLIPYGPPVTPVLIGAGYILLGGPSDFAAVLPGLACGSLAVLVLGRLAAAIFSPRAGLFSAMLLATSGAAVAFSRSALTDAPLMLVWLVAMLAGLHFLKKPGFVSACGLGLGVGLCQLTKYNGALTGVIVALTAMADFIFVPRENKRDTELFLRRIGWGIFGAILAALIYAPWFQFVERHGGYRALMKHHGGYMGGLATWPDHLKLQLAQASVFQLQWVLMVIGSFGLLALGLRKSSGAIGLKETDRLWAIIATLILWICPNLLWVGAIVMAPALLRSASIGQRMAAVWLLFLSVLTPFYHPYARLWLPTMLASQLVAGWLLDELWNGQWQQMQQASNRWRQWTCKKEIWAACVIWLAVTTFQRPAELPGVWSGRGQLRAEMQAMVSQIQKATAAGKTVALYISPAARWQLRNSTPPGGFGPGRLVNLAELKRDQPGPLVVDCGLLNQAERGEILARLNQTGAELKPVNEPNEIDRGLITTLDIAPGSARGESVPRIGLIWLAD